VAEHPLIAIRAKMDRADEHLSTLQDELQRARRDEPLVIRFEVNFKTGWHTAYVENPKPVPPVSAFSPERACTKPARLLEHLVWALVKATHKKPGKDHTFPIRTVAVGTKGLTNAQAFIRATKARELAGVRAAAVALIERLQPYNTAHPSDYFLTILNEMARDDRHHAIHSAFVGGDPKEMRSLFVPRGSAKIVGFRTLLSKRANLAAVGRTNVARLRVLPLSRKAKVDVYGNLTAPIAFGDRHSVLLLSDFRAMNAEVRQVLGLFEEFF
jgi:hypothetical protein